jgi:hypothetical protein
MNNILVFFVWHVKNGMELSVCTVYNANMHPCLIYFVRYSS